MWWYNVSVKLARLHKKTERNKDMTIKIAENLQMLRKAKGLTQEKLSQVFGVTNQSISKWELGLSCSDITVLPNLQNTTV